ncbi:SDR family NAD(P)-dependent oxidoreductase [Sulfurimonas sp. HSL3-7]|uniref:SDR family NAD(P)-dependent oxidoreductase n=1 Tax=Sulfonitrofixus jiaomeiensis TaxID=3131938 RepID=UPI0031F9F06C
MGNQLNGKRVLVTGATSGIGKACAHRLAEAGTDLVLCGRNGEKLEALKQAFGPFGVDIKVLVFDVRNRKEVESRLSILLETTAIDILINNAGLALGLEAFDGGDVDQWEEMIDANIKGLLYVSRAVVPQMRRRNSGHILNIGSIAGKMTYPGGNVYSATKAAVHALGEAMNIDLAGTAVRVGNIAPGAVETNFSNTRFSGDETRADAVYEGYEPLHPEDIADLALYILNAPSHVNIQDVLVMPTAQRNPYVHSRNG